MQERPANATSRPVGASQAPEVHPDTPTVQDDWRAALAAQMGHDSFRELRLDALLPTVRRIVAAELRAAAVDIIAPMVLTGNATPNAVRALLNRADDLDATPDHGKA